MIDSTDDVIYKKMMSTSLNHVLYVLKGYFNLKKNLFKKSH